MHSVTAFEHDESVVHGISTTVVFEEFETDLNRQFWTYKLEGMAILNANHVALTNDNDFGVVGDPDGSHKSLDSAVGESVAAGGIVAPFWSDGPPPRRL